MKQLYIILSIIIIASIITAVKVFTPPQPNNEPAALIINDKVITQSQLKQKLSQKTNDLSQEGYISALINKELLIQEAQRLKIDQEESFRLSLQDFYEQSLIKSLISRKRASQEITIPDSQLNRYEALLGKELLLGYMIADNIADAEASKFNKEEKLTLRFADLSDIAQYYLTRTNAAEPTPPFEIDGKWVRMKLLDANGEEVSELPPTIKEQIRNNLSNSARMVAQTRWIQELRQNAKIEILINTPKADGS